MYIYIYYTGWSGISVYKQRLIRTEPKKSLVFPTINVYSWHYSLYLSIRSFYYFHKNFPTYYSYTVWPYFLYRILTLSLPVETRAYDLSSVDQHHRSPQSCPVTKAVQTLPIALDTIAHKVWEWALCMCLNTEHENGGWKVLTGQNLKEDFERSFGSQKFLL